MYEKKKDINVLTHTYTYIKYSHTYTYYHTTINNVRASAKVFLDYSIESLRRVF